MLPIVGLVRLEQFLLGQGLDGRQCGNNLALCNFAVVMELPDSLYMNWKSEFGVIFLRCSPRFNANFFQKKSESSLLKMCFNIEYSCHTITNIKHGWRLSLQLMTN